MSTTVTHLTEGTTYRARTTGTLNGARIYGDIVFAASRDQEVEPFLRDREGTPDQDRVFRSYDNFGSVPILVVSGSIEIA